MGKTHKTEDRSLFIYGKISYKCNLNGTIKRKCKTHHTLQKKEDSGQSMKWTMKDTRLFIIYIIVGSVYVWLFNLFSSHHHSYLSLLGIGVLYVYFTKLLTKLEKKKRT